MAVESQMFHGPTDFLFENVGDEAIKLFGSNHYSCSMIAGINFDEELKWKSRQVFERSRSLKLRFMVH